MSSCNLYSKEFPLQWHHFSQLQLEFKSLYIYIYIYIYVTKIHTINQVYNCYIYVF